MKYTTQEQLFHRVIMSPDTQESLQFELFFPLALYFKSEMLKQLATNMKESDISMKVGVSIGTVLSQGYQVHREMTSWVV